MCGIAGIWQGRPAAASAGELLARMNEALRHRGPDDSGTFFDQATGVGLAFRRLSILDLSPQGHQPMFSRSGRYAIIFNGEVYNFEDLRAQLSGPWRGHSDTEVILEAVERWGLRAAVQRFVGMFAIAMWDREQRTLHLVRDRLGIKPLYYGRVNDDFVFASELKAIAQHPEFGFEIDRGALALFLRHSYIPYPHCIYRGLRKLPPGCMLTLNSPAEDGTVKPYWSAWEAATQGLQAPFAGSDDEAVAELERRLTDAVRLRMIADVPLGAFLSGGLDSSAVVALMQAQSGRPVKTFTIGFHEDEYNEAAYARRVAEHLGTEHTELYVTAQDAFNVVPTLPAMFDEPFADPSQIPTYLVSKLARESVTVSLSGDGGDELFGGYTRYFKTRSMWNSLRRIPRPITRLGAAAALSMKPRTLNSVARAMRFLLPNGMDPAKFGEKVHRYKGMLRSLTPQSMYLQTLSQWTAPAEIALGSQEPDTVVRSLEAAATLPSLEEMMMFTDLVNYLPEDILTKVDRASMAVSLEARVPLLDHRVVEFAWRLPLRMRMRKNTSKWILRQVLYRHVPAELMERPKMGFGVPIDHWLRGPLRQWAEDLLSVDSLRRHGYLNAPAIREKWEQHLAPSHDWQYPLWNVLMFQQWLEEDRRACRRSAPPVPDRSAAMGTSALSS